MAAYFRRSLDEIHKIKLHLYIDHHELKSPFTYQQGNRCICVFLSIGEMFDYLWDEVPVNMVVCNPPSNCGLHDDDLCCHSDDMWSNYHNHVSVT